VSPRGGFGLLYRHPWDVERAMRWRVLKRRVACASTGMGIPLAMRASLLRFGLTAAALAVVVGSCLWAWASPDFWRAVPLYPAVVVAGVLSGFASQAWRSRIRRATLDGLGATLVTLLGTALITLARWGW
jgi:Na+/glutamate symporter